MSKVAIALLILNEIRGLIVVALVAPALWEKVFG